MDWRFNTIWFDQIDNNKIYRKDFKDNNLKSPNISFEDSEYATIWYLRRKDSSFDNLAESTKLLYLELNWANIIDFSDIHKFGSLKRLELRYCTKLESDMGLSQLSESLEFLHINQSKKFAFTDELLNLKKLKVLRLNACASIESLEFLNNFPELIDFRFVDTNIIDGNLNPIIEHPTIRSVGYLNKRHYTIKDQKMDLKLAKKFDSEYKMYVDKGQYSTFRYSYE